MNLQIIIQNEKIWEDYILYVSIYVTFWKWRNYVNGGQINGCQEINMVWGWEGSRCVDIKGDIYGERNVLCVGHILVVILSKYYILFGKLSLLGNIPEEYWRSLCIISYNYIWFYNDLKIKILINRYTI